MITGTQSIINTLTSNVRFYPTITAVSTISTALFENTVSKNSNNGQYVGILSIALIITQFTAPSKNIKEKVAYLSLCFPIFSFILWLTRPPNFSLSKPTDLKNLLRQANRFNEFEQAIKEKNIDQIKRFSNLNAYDCYFANLRAELHQPYFINHSKMAEILRYSPPGSQHYTRADNDEKDLYCDSWLIELVELLVNNNETNELKKLFLGSSDGYPHRPRYRYLVDCYMCSTLLTGQSKEFITKWIQAFAKIGELNECVQETFLFSLQLKKHDIAKQIIEAGFDTNSPLNHRSKILTNALRNLNLSLAKQLIEAGAKTPYLPLFEAAKGLNRIPLINMNAEIEDYTRAFKELCIFLLGKTSSLDSEKTRTNILLKTMVLPLTGGEIAFYTLCDILELPSGDNLKKIISRVIENIISKNHRTTWNLIKLQQFIEEKNIDLSEIFNEKELFFDLLPDQIEDYGQRNAFSREIYIQHLKIFKKFFTVEQMTQLVRPVGREQNLYEAARNRGFPEEQMIKIFEATGVAATTAKRAV